MKSLLAELTEKRIRNVHGVLFQGPDGIIEWGSGELEFELEGGRIVRLLGGGGNDELGVATERWTSYSLTPEAAQMFGIWTRVPLNDQFGWKQIQGLRADSVSLLKNRFGEACGAKIYFESSTVLFVVAADEAFFTCVTDIDALLESWEIQEGQ